MNGYIPHILCKERGLYTGTPNKYFASPFDREVRRAEPRDTHPSNVPPNPNASSNRLSFRHILQPECGEMMAMNVLVVRSLSQTILVYTAS